MKPRTRLDRVVQLRERAEDHALHGLVRARSESERARDNLARAVTAARADQRAAGPVELFAADELARRRALQLVRAAEHAVHQAQQGEVKARDGYAAARQARQAVSRVQERKQGEILKEIDVRERKGLDELATLRFNHRG